MPLRNPFGTSARRHGEVMRVLAAILHRQDKQETIMADINTRMHDLQVAEQAEAAQIEELLADDVAVRQQLAAALAAAKNAPTPETMQALEDLIGKSQANKDRIADALKAATQPSGGFTPSGNVPAGG